jgi:hypothetical protein
MIDVAHPDVEGQGPIKFDGPGAAESGSKVLWWSTPAATRAMGDLPVPEKP